jgi:hypothetical protein
MVTKRRRVATHAIEELQFAAGFTDRGGERRAHAVVTGVEIQHGALLVACGPPLGNQRANRAKPPRVVSSLSVNGE